MKSVLLFALATVQTLVLTQVHGEASFQPCGSVLGWAAGKPDNFNPGQHAATYSAGGNTCKMTISPVSTTYNPGQTFTVTVTSSSSMGYKIESTAGTLSNPSGNGAQGETTRCINYNKASQSSATMTFTAPASGNVQVRAICSARTGPVYAADNIVTLTPGNIPTSSPTTAKPTKPGDTPSPTFVATNSPTTQSSDPNFDFEIDLTAGFAIFYKANNTHVKFKLTQPNNAFIGLGPGTQEIGSTVIVGMDPTINAPLPGVGIYKMLSKTGSTPAQIMSNVATTSTTLAAMGIVETSFTNIAGVGATMLFTVVRAKQTPQFTLVSQGATSAPINFVWAVGPASSKGAFCSGGTCAPPNKGAFGQLSADFLVAPAINTQSALRNPVPLSSDLTTHIITMVIGWGILIPLGIAIPLFNNIKYSPTNRALCRMSGPMWVKYHWILQVLGLILTYVGTVTGYNEVGDNHWRDTHMQLGLLLLIGSILQPALAFIRPSPGVKEGLKGAVRKIFDWTHLPLGYILVFLGIITNITGVNEVSMDSTGGAPYIFNGMVGNVGLNGPMGMAILLISLLFTGILGFGLMRAGYVRFFYNKGGNNAMMAYGEEGGDGLGKMRRMVGFAEIEQHNNPKSFWVIYQNKVYDVTSFLDSHPGGKKVILPYAGKDMTQAYNDAGHSAKATSMLQQYYVGELQRVSRLRTVSQRLSMGFQQMRQYMAMPDGFSSKRFSAAMSRFSSMPQGWGMYPGSQQPQEDPRKFLSGNNQQKRQVVLTEKVPISPDSYYMKFSFPGAPQKVLGLPTGKHISIWAPAYPGRTQGKWNGKADKELQDGEISRKFTPITSDEVDVGYFALVVKVYRPSKQFPDGGRMSMFLENLRVGQTISISGPFGTHQYIGKGRMIDSGREVNFNEVAMIAGGSGITPVLQIATAMLRDRQDYTRVSLIYANSSVEDILMKDYLDQLVAQYPNRFRIWYTVSKDPKQSAYSYYEWPFSVGRISKKMMQEHLPAGNVPSCVAIHCGPPSMMQAVNKFLKELGFSEDRVIEY